VHGLVGPELDDTFFCPNCHTNGSVRIAAPSVRPDQRQWCAGLVAMSIATPWPCAGGNDRLPGAFVMESVER
jgi:hypothetical protein